MGRPDKQHILSRQTCSKLHVSHLDCTCTALRLLLHTVLQFGRVLMVCTVLRVLFLKVIYAASRLCHPICKYCRHALRVRLATWFPIKMIQSIPNGATLCQAFTKRCGTKVFYADLVTIQFEASCRAVEPPSRGFFCVCLQEGDDSSALEDAAPTSPKGSAGESTPKRVVETWKFFWISQDLSSGLQRRPTFVWDRLELINALWIIVNASLLERCASSLLLTFNSVGQVGRVLPILVAPGQNAMCTWSTFCLQNWQTSMVCCGDDRMSNLDRLIHVRWFQGLVFAFWRVACPDLSWTKRHRERRRALKF